MLQGLNEFWKCRAYRTHAHYTNNEMEEKELRPPVVRRACRRSKPVSPEPCTALSNGIYLYKI